MRNRAAFTFTEMLVLASVGFLLVGAALPSLDGAKQKLQASQCLSNMRQWGLAFGMYCDDYHDYLPDVGGIGLPINAGYNLTAWFNVLPRYMNQTPLKDLYAATNTIPVPGMKSVYICPSRTDLVYTATSDFPYFNYAMNRLMSGVISASTSNALYKRTVAALPGRVILLSEAECGSSANFPSTDGYYLSQHGPNGVGSTIHNGGDNFLFVDGHAEWEPLAAYQRDTSTCCNPAVEWQTPRQVYWFPCSTCNKSGVPRG